jgi:hypothetical protein
MLRAGSNTYSRKRNSCPDDKAINRALALDRHSYGGDRLCYAPTAGHHDRSLRGGDGQHARLTHTSLYSAAGDALPLHLHRSECADFQCSGRHWAQRSGLRLVACCHDGCQARRLAFGGDAHGCHWLGVPAARSADLRKPRSLDQILQCPSGCAGADRVPLEGCSARRILARLWRATQGFGSKVQPMPLRKNIAARPSRRLISSSSLRALT